MPKKIWQQFDGGLGDSDKLLSDNQFYSGRDIDIYRDWGYAMPGFAVSDITITGQGENIIDIVFDNVNSRAYLISDVAKIYAVNTATDADIGNGFGGGSQNYVSITGMVEAKGMIYYLTQDSAYRVLIPYNGTAKDIAKGVLGADWSGTNLDVDWGSTVPTGGGTLQTGRRDIIEFQGYAWITNGRYVGRIDGTVATTTFTPLFFDLGADWTADRLFVTNNYLGIVASRNTSNFVPSAGRNQNECRIYLIDGSSNTSAVKIIPLKGITQVHSVINKNGTIILFCDSGSTGHIIAVLQDNGLEEVRTLKHDISGTLTNLLSPRSSSALAVYKNRLLFGTEGRGLIMSYGNKDIGKPFALTCPFSASIVANSLVSSLSKISNDKFYLGYYNGTNYKFAKLSSGNSTNASIKFGYFDAGQKMRLNYIKVYFKPLIASDSITVGIDTDYGSSQTLGIGTGNVGYGNDGAITSKRFDKPILCHALRPTITWVNGGVEISKIIIDYSFVDDI